MSALAFLVALVLAVLGQGPTPAPHRVTVSPAAPASAAAHGPERPAVSLGPHSGGGSPAPTVAAPPPAPSCAAGEEFQGEFGCVAVQLGGETDGRAYG